MDTSCEIATVDISCDCLHMHWRDRNREKRLKVSVENAAREGSWGKLAELASIWMQMEREKSELFIYLIFGYSLGRPKGLCSPINMATTDQTWFMSITNWPTPNSLPTGW